MLIDERQFKVGDSVQVVRPRNITELLWVVVGCHPDGSLRWESKSGFCYFLDSDRRSRRAYVNGLSRICRQVSPNDTTASVEHHVQGWRTYRATAIFHRVRPLTALELARERLAEAYNPEAL